MNLNLKSGKPKRLIGLTLRHDGFKPTNALEWQSEVVSVMFLLSDVLLTISMQE